jgi:hypothetical protein
MAAHADLHVPRSRGLVARLRAHTARLELDHALATGADPRTTAPLARRAEVLRRRRVRERLARGLERIVAEAAAPPHEHGADVPVQREEVLAARRDLLRLVAALRSAPGPGVRCIATVSLLLTDGTGPVFAPYPHGTLRQAAFQAAFQAEAG